MGHGCKRHQCGYRHPSSVSCRPLARPPQLLSRFEARLSDCRYFELRRRRSSSVVFVISLETMAGTMSALTNCGLHRAAVHHSLVKAATNDAPASSSSVSFPAVHCSCKLPGQAFSLFSGTGTFSDWLSTLKLDLILQCGHVASVVLYAVIVIVGCCAIEGLIDFQERSIRLRTIRSVVLDHYLNDVVQHK